MKKILFLLFSFWVLPALAEMPKEQVEIETRLGARHVFSLEVASTPQQLEQGLMYRTELESMTGMLFLFPMELPDVSFWMKNTLIPLDMLFVQSDGVIKKVHANAQPQDLTPISSGGPVRAVIELAGGRAAALNIQPGDKVFAPSFLSTPQD
jgi:uncharacterized protein